MKPSQQEQQADGFINSFKIGSIKQHIKVANESKQQIENYLKKEKKSHRIGKAHKVESSSMAGFKFSISGIALQLAYFRPLISTLLITIAVATASVGGQSYFNRPPIRQRQARYAPPPPASQPFFRPPPPPLPLPPPASSPEYRSYVESRSAGDWKNSDLVREIIMPYDGFSHNGTGAPVSYVIDNKRFVEAVNSRCWSSTALEDPMTVEPSFIIIRQKSEIRLNATAPISRIQMAGFDPSLTTKLLIHGFTQSYPSTGWLRKTRALFEKHAKVNSQNLIIMDWGSASQGSYAQVAGMVSGMGSFLANFLMKLLELGADRSKIHLIGHSLGAHLAGFAGKRIKPKIGRITALDPAGPCFGKFFSNSPQDRLEANDAYEVDVYHYDDTFLGLPGQHGHFDIYVNGGSSQPGCTGNVNAMFQALITIIMKRDRVLSESHTRSTEVPTCELAAVNCQQVAYECRDYAAFNNGECGRCDDFNGQCFLMGFDHQYMGMRELPLRTSSPGKRLFIRTGPNELYCLQHYQILVKFEPTPEMVQASKRNKWRLHLDLLTDRHERLNVTLSNQMAPNVFSYLLLTEAQPFRFVGAQLQVHQSDGNLIPLSPIQYQQQYSSSNNKIAPIFWPFAMEINFMSNIDPDTRRVLSSRLCPTASMSTSTINQISGTGSMMVEPNQWLQFDECLTPSPGR